jgi:hypothetical protein
MATKRSLISLRSPREEFLYALEPFEYHGAGEEFVQLLPWARDARAIQGQAIALRMRVSLRISGMS